MNIPLEDLYAGVKDADVLIYNGTIEGTISTKEELLARCALLAECKAVQNGDIWCTTPSFFQQSMALADFMLDLHAVFTGENCRRHPAFFDQRSPEEPLMTSRKRLVFSYCCLALLLAVLFAVSLFWGSVALTPQAVLAALTGRGQDALSVGIITQLRLPRAVMAALLGAALSAAGYLLQTFFANPIAGPFVMGISSGAKLAVALVMVLFLNYGLLTSSAVLILAAFAGAMAAMAFVLAAARRVQRMSILVICGVMIGYICSAITEFVVAFAQDSSIVNLHNWSQGSFSGMTWGNVRTAALVVLPALAAAFCLSKPMAAYQMGEAYARSVGVNVQAVFPAAGAAFQSAGRLCHGLCGAHLLCGHRGAAPGQAAAGQRPAAVCAAGLLPGRGGVLPAVRPNRPQPVCAHGAFHQRGHGCIRCTGGHLGCCCAATGRMCDEKLR